MVMMVVRVIVTVMEMVSKKFQKVLFVFNRVSIVRSFSFNLFPKKKVIR